MNEADDQEQNLPFSQVKHEVATLDAQPASEDGSIVALVTGALLVRSGSLGSECRTDRSRLRASLSP
jgi:hypothetical protein